MHFAQTNWVLVFNWHENDLLCHAKQIIEYQYVIIKIICIFQQHVSHEKLIEKYTVNGVRLQANVASAVLTFIYLEL